MQMVFAVFQYGILEKIFVCEMDADKYIVANGQKGFTKEMVELS